MSGLFLSEKFSQKSLIKSATFDICVYICIVNNYRMSKKNKFTFKLDKPSGAYRSFYKPSCDIKLNKRVCGSITYTKIINVFEIRFMVIKTDIMEDGNPNCVWRWVNVTKNFSTIDKAKEWIRQRNDSIQDELKLYLAEN